MATETGTAVHPVTQVMDDLAAAVAEGCRSVAEGLWQLPEAEVLAVLDAQHRAVAQLEALQLAVLRQVSERSIAANHGLRNPAALLTQRLRLHPGEAHARARLAEAVAERHHDVRDALAAGDVDLDQARAISEALDRLPRQATPGQRQDAETYLLDAAGQQNPKQLVTTARMIGHVIDPDGKLEDHDRAEVRRSLDFGQNRDGAPTARLHTTAEGMALLKTAIDALSAPVPDAEGEPDPRSAGQRRHDALLSLVKHELDHGDLPRNHGVRPHLNITVTEPALRGEPGAAFGVSATGEELSPQTIARLACDAEITAYLLSGSGVVLHMGRTTRTVTPQQWRALVVRDIGCIFYGCDRPAAHCEAHHLIWWRHDGPTDIENLALLCDFHHHVVHKPGWKAEMGSDGKPVVIPAPWVDPNQQSRVNQHWRAGPEFAAYHPLQTAHP